MLIRKMAYGVVYALSFISLANTAQAGHLIPFLGYWEGATVGAEPTDDPDVVLVTTAGKGIATVLGPFEMISPHLSNLLTMDVEGQHVFTAINGDELVGEFTGQFSPTEDGFLVANLRCQIVGGTGLFEDARGRYVFHILFDPATFESVAIIFGRISLW